MTSDESSGLHCLEHSKPEFRSRVKQGFNIIVAGKGFGCGSSREQAVMALVGKLCESQGTSVLSLNAPDFQGAEYSASLPNHLHSFSSAICRTSGFWE